MRIRLDSQATKRGQHIIEDPAIVVDHHVHGAEQTGQSFGPPQLPAIDDGDRLEDTAELAQQTHHGGADDEQMRRPAVLPGLTGQVQGDALGAAEIADRRDKTDMESRTIQDSGEKWAGLNQALSQTTRLAIGAKPHLAL